LPLDPTFSHRTSADAFRARSADPWSRDISERSGARGRPPRAGNLVPLTAIQGYSILGCQELISCTRTDPIGVSLSRL